MPSATRPDGFSAKQRSETYSLGIISDGPEARGYGVGSGGDDDLLAMGE